MRWNLKFSWESWKKTESWKRLNQSYILSSTLSPMSFLSFWLLLTMWYLPRDRKQWKDIRVTFLSLLLWLDCSLKSTGLSHRETSCLRWQVGEAQQWGEAQYPPLSWWEPGQTVLPQPATWDGTTQWPFQRIHLGNQWGRVPTFHSVWFLFRKGVVYLQQSINSIINRKEAKRIQKYNIFFFFRHLERSNHPQIKFHCSGWLCKAVTWHMLQKLQRKMPPLLSTDSKTLQPRTEKCHFRYQLLL